MILITCSTTQCCVSAYFSPSTDSKCMIGKTILSRILSMLCRLFLQTNCSVSDQYGSVLCPVNRFTSVSQTLNEYGQVKNTWSLVSSLSPHRAQPCCIPQPLIISLVDSLFLTASHTINEKRGSELLG